MLIRNFTLSLILLFGFSLQALAFDVPALQGPVMDEVGLLDAGTQASLATAHQKPEPED